MSYRYLWRVEFIREHGQCIGWDVLAPTFDEMMEMIAKVRQGREIQSIQRRILTNHLGFDAVTR